MAPLNQGIGNQTDYGEVVFGNGKEQRQFALASDVSYDMVNIFARRVAEGEPGPDDHPVFSSWTAASWTGGMGVNKFNPSSDMGRYWDSTMDVLYPGALMPAPRTIKYSNPGGVANLQCWPLGDFGNKFCASWGGSLYSYVPTSDTWSLETTTVHNLPVNKWTYYNDGLALSNSKNVFIPQGSNGYDTWIGTGPTVAGVSGVSAIDFTTYNNSIFALTTDGRLLQANKFPTILADWVLITTIPDDVTPQHLVTYKDFGGNPCIYVVTDKYVYALDFTNKILFTTDLVFPKHPKQGEASVVHKGDMAVSVGLGAHRYDTNTITSDGLDGGDGLPVNMRGFINSFDTAYNGLYALVQGAPLLSNPATSDNIIQAGSPDQPLSGPLGLTQNYLALKTDYGWSQRAKFDGLIPTSVHVSDSSSYYAVWFGGGSGFLYKQVLPTIYYNPRDLANDVVERERSGYMESSWYYWGWEGQPKVAKQLDVSILTASAEQTVLVEIKFDDDGNSWQNLGTISAAGEYTFRLGRNPFMPDLLDGSPYYEGVPHERVKIKFTFTNTSSDWMKCAKLQWMSLVARRYLRPQRQWTVPLDLTRSYKGFTTIQNLAFLTALAVRQTGVFFQIGQEQYVVDIVSLGGRRHSGPDESSQLSLNLVESFDVGPEDATQMYIDAQTDPYTSPDPWVFTGDA